MVGQPTTSEGTIVLPLMLLRQGMPGIPSDLGGTLASCAALCLESQGHSSGVQLEVEGEAHWLARIEWEQVTPQMRRGYADPDEATEFGAAAVGILLAKAISGFSVVERGVKGTGFDYWLGDDGDFNDETYIVKKRARLEVSGIRRGSRFLIRRRLKHRSNQTQKSDDTRLPAYISIVEFRRPFAFLVKR